MQAWYDLVVRKSRRPLLLLIYGVLTIAVTIVARTLPTVNH